MASAFTAARFINGESISGNPLGLRIAAMNVPNLVNLQSGSWGSVIVDGLNITRSTTLANFNTLASLVAYASTSAGDDWRCAVLQGGNAKRRNDAVEHAWSDGRHCPSAVGASQGPLRTLRGGLSAGEGRFAERGAVRALPACTPPKDFALVLRFSGGGVYAPGRLMFDADGNLWSGVNWMPGSQSNAAKNIGGGAHEVRPRRLRLSPPVTGFTGQGPTDVGWGTAVTRENVWVSSFNGKILVTDLQGRPVASEQDFPFKEKLSGLMGIGVAANGDVWIADSVGNQLLFFPGGRVKEGRIVKVAGLAGPFDVVIDDQNRVSVSNSRSDTVVRFPANDPKQGGDLRVGVSARALALDSKSNVWAVSILSPDFPGLKPLPPDASIMQEFKAFSVIFAGLNQGR